MPKPQNLQLIDHEGEPVSLEGFRRPLLIQILRYYG